MFESVFRILMWMFVAGMVGCFSLVIPITAYRLFSVLFEKDTSEESNPYQQRLTSP
jgi:hypothetical protein